MTEPRSAQKRLADLLRRARLIEMAGWLDREPSEIRQDLLPEISWLLDAAHEAVESIGAMEPPGRHRSAWDDLHDLCSVTDMVLAEKAQSLKIPRSDAGVWSSLGAAEWALAEVRNAILSIERHLAAAYGLESRTEAVDPLAESLETRRLLTELRRAVLAPIESLDGSGEPPREALRAADAAFGRLMDDERRRRLRIDDLLHVRRIRERIEDVIFASPGSAGDTDLEAERLLTDVRSFAVLLADVNHREELVAHDRAVLAEATETLEATPSPTPPPETLEALATLFGRDDALDSLLAGDEPVDGEALLDAVRRVARELAAHDRAGDADPSLVSEAWQAG
jgi:hypothetical protein